MIKEKHNFYILTGGPGSGKSSIIQELKKRNYVCVDEVGRQIILEQTQIRGDAIHTKNQIKFRDLMLSRSIVTYDMVMEHLSPVFFDRGIPDLIGYCHLIHTDVPDYLQHAVRIYRYNPLVFIAPPWQDIYQHDSERKQGWEEAVDTYTNIAAAYVAAGYQLLEIPKASVAERANFILEHI